MVDSKANIGSNVLHDEITVVSIEIETLSPFDWHLERGKMRQIQLTIAGAEDGSDALFP